MPKAADTARRALDAAVVRALAAVGAEAAQPAADPLADPAGARRALERVEPSGSLLLRVAPPLAGGAAVEPAAASEPASSYAPAPRDPMWLRLRQGSAEVAAASLRDGGSGETAARLALRVSLDSVVLPCCGSASCTAKKTLASAWLELEPRAGEPARLLLTEALDLDGGAAAARVEQLARPVAELLGVPWERGEATDRADASRASTPPVSGTNGTEEDPLLSAERLHRFAMRSEGAGRVLRDHGSDGPRAGAGRLLTIAAVLGAAAVALWIFVARGARQDESRGMLLGVGVVAALLSLTAYAFFGVGRFAMRYGARSTPLLWVGQGRLTAMPWVARDGRVDLRPEGRFGASIPLGEVRGAEVRQREHGFVIELETDHGPIDILPPVDERLAAYWCAALRPVLADAAHPEPKTSARQRARARGRIG